jgi:hypothetical protein
MPLLHAIPLPKTRPSQSGLAPMDEACSRRRRSGLRVHSAPKDDQKLGAGIAHDVLVLRVGKDGIMKLAESIVELQQDDLLYLSTTMSCSQHAGQAQGKEYLACYLDQLINGYKPD